MDEIVLVKLDDSEVWTRNEIFVLGNISGDYIFAIMAASASYYY
jgi:hypothetical protein